jgi:putative CocE/NonD family hydrolase
VNTALFDIRWGVKIPLRDGILLSATLYAPGIEQGASPCVLMMTPYIADSHHERGVYFAMHGLCVAIVDVRGRGNSQGEFRPFIQEAQDGYDAVEWLARQPYCNGQVAMCGASYLGYDQWATAKERPPHLVTMVPAAAACAGVDFPFRNNIFAPFLVQWLVMTGGRAAQRVVGADQSLWCGLWRRWHESGRAFREIDSFAGFPSKVFQEWLDHPAPDAYWDSFNPSPEQYAQLELPILTITGSYDDNQAGALAHYQAHEKCATASARKRHYLIIGPWDHAGSGWAPRPEFGGLKFGAASLVDVPKLHREWFSWTLEQGPKPDFLEDRVAYYVMGAERWRYAPTLDAVTSHQLSLHLDSGGTANHLDHSGWLAAELARGPPDSYVFDPRDTTGPEIAAEENSPTGSLVDSSVAAALGTKQLIYHSQSLDSDTEVSGFFKLSAWLSIDCPDTDLYVTVYEVNADGAAIRLTTDGQRARYREGSRLPKLITTREPLRYDFDRFTFVSRLVKQGNRLRLVIAPLGRLIDPAFSEKNYNGGGVVTDESARDARPVTVKIFHDATHPSVLQVPIGQVER